jgi:pimeloyl-ACP methyl ester carboxylesterase
VEVLAMPAGPELLFDGPTDAPRTFALAHGAGAGMDSPFMAPFAKGLAKRGFRVARFEYPYTASKRVTGKQKPPDREPVLRETWLKVVNMLGREGPVIEGKSMGGRIASLVADEAGVAGLVCLGYPFHPIASSGAEPAVAETGGVEIRAADLAMLLDGVDLESGQSQRGTPARPRDSPPGGLFAPRPSGR